MKADFVWEDFNRPELKLLRNRYGLEKVVSSGKDKFEKQLLLKKWVFATLPLGYNNTNQYRSALEVLDDQENKGGFNCSWYVLVYLQCAITLGWYVRKLGIDTDHDFGEEEMRHTVVDIWSKKHKKWFVIDPMFNAHFEKDGTPLNSHEIRKHYLNGKKVKKVFGNYEQEILSEKVKERNDNPNNYFWFFILLRNNYLVNPDVYDSKALLWIDEHNKDKTWHVGGRNKGEFKRHPMYEGAFIETNDYSLCFPTMV